MPTGYTADVESGKVTDFRIFALRCARAFGACVEQRDESLEVLPTPRRVSSYHIEALDRARTRLKTLDAMTPAEAGEQAAQQYAEAVQRSAEGRARKELEAGRYARMLESVKAWTPPTADHQGLKDFMIQQITESTKYSNYAWPEPEQVTGEAWLIAERLKAHKDVEYHAAECRKEQERVDESNAWLAALEKSLPGVGGSR